MNIKELIKQEAPKDDAHDKAYSEALNDCYELYKDLPLITLEELQPIARECYSGNHSTTAACIVLNSLIDEKSALPVSRN